MIKKEEVTIEVDKMYCDVCGKEKDICFNCLQKKINEAIEELYRK